MGLNRNIRKSEQQELDKLYKKMLRRENMRHVAEESHYIRQKKALFSQLGSSSPAKPPSRLKRWYMTSSIQDDFSQTSHEIKSFFHNVEYNISHLRYVWDDLWASIKERKRSMLAILTCFMLIGVGLFVYDIFYGYEVVFNGQIIGIIDNKDDFEQALINVDNQLFEWYENPNIFYEHSISYRRVPITNKKEVMDEEACEEKILDGKIDLFCNGAIIMVNGEEAVKVASKEQAEAVITQVKEKYSAKEDEVIVEAPVIEENISIEEKIIPLTSVKRIDEAVTYLSEGASDDSLRNSDGTEADALENTNETTNLVSALNFRRDSFSLVDNISTKPVITIRTVKKVVYEEEVAFEITYKDDSSVYVGAEEIASEGENGVKKVTAIQTFENGEVVATEVLNEKVVQEPVNQVVARGTKPLPPASSTGRFLMPASGQISAINKAGSHAGGRALDIANRTGSAVYASDSGVVSMSGWYGGYGNCIIIDHGNGYQTLYGHNSENLVRVGDTVNQGQQIARMGSTGNSSGSHCHFEIKLYGERLVIKNFFSYLADGVYVQALQ